MRTLLKVALVAALLGCEKEAQRGEAGRVPAGPLPPPGASTVDQPHVVFTATSLVLDALGVPVAAPVSSASRPSAATMQSDDPRIVEIGANGMLVARAHGKTVVRAVRGTSSLDVTVVAPSAILVRPARLELEPRGRAPVQVFDLDGSLVPPEAVRWVVPTGPAVGIVGGEVHAMGRPGIFEIRAEVGQVSAPLVVTVSHQGPDQLRISPAMPRFRRGEVKVLQAVTPDGGVAADWTSDNAGVLISLGRGLFQAKKAGKSNVCASALDQSACSVVEVLP